MLYQAIRPSSFEEMIGNEAVVTALKKIIECPAELRPHAFLFAGSSGCGKTTLARIVAKALGCSDMDLRELNAANTNGIQTVRDVVASASLAPMEGPCKVIIFDESHELTGKAQEALLKSIEDTYLHVHYIFCTTDPDQLIKTIQNRCTRFDVMALRYPQMAELIMTASEVADVPVSDNVLQKLIECAEGCPREAIVNLEKLRGLSEEALS